MTRLPAHPQPGRVPVAVQERAAAFKSPRRVVFLDKDGTLVKDVPYNVDPDRMVLEDGAARGLSLLARAGFRFIVVSNQSGVARGCFPEDALRGVYQRLQDLLWVQAGATLDGFYYCPHHPGGSLPAYAVECECRKPLPGMLLAAARDLNVDLRGAWMVGDILNDVEAGRRAGSRAILINNGGETEWLAGPLRQPDFMASNLEEAAGFILANSQENEPAETQPAR